MRAGRLRRRLTIQVRNTAQDAVGQQLSDWNDLLAGVPADIEGLSGREILAAQAVNAEVTHRIHLRYHPLLVDPVKVAAMRAVYVNGGVYRTFEFASRINVDERNREITLLATEGLVEGYDPTSDQALATLHSIGVN